MITISAQLYVPPRLVVISFPDLLWTKPKARSGQIRFALRDHLSGMWQGRQVRLPNIKADFVILSCTTSLRQAYDMTWEYSLESLNFVAFTKPNKHKWRSKGFFYNLAGFVFEYFYDSRRILVTFEKFCLNSLFATWSYRFTRHPARARSSFPPSPTQIFWRKKLLLNLFPSPNCYRQISLKRFWY